MSKKEKIIAICFIVSFVLVLVSCVVTLKINKLEGQIFYIEKVLNNF